jgi:hypothetical protein
MNQLREFRLKSPVARGPLSCPRGPARGVRRSSRRWPPPTPNRRGLQLRPRQGEGERWASSESPPPRYGAEKDHGIRAYGLPQGYEFGLIDATRRLQRRAAFWERRRRLPRPGAAVRPGLLDPDLTLLSPGGPPGLPLRDRERQAHRGRGRGHRLPGPGQEVPRVLRAQDGGWRERRVRGRGPRVDAARARPGGGPGRSPPGLTGAGRGYTRSS